MKATLPQTGEGKLKSVYSNVKESCGAVAQV